MTRKFRLEQEQRQRQENQKHSGDIHRQDVHGVKRQQQADAANDARREQSRMCEFRVETQHAENQQNEKNVRLHNPRQKPLAQGQLKGRAHGVAQFQFRLRAVKSFDRAPIELVEEFLGRRNNQIDELAVERFFLGESFRIGHGCLGQRHVAPALAGKASQVSRGIIRDFSPQRFVNLHRKRPDADERRRCPGVRPGRHGRHVRGQQNEKPGRRAPRPRRRDVHHDRHG